MDLGRQMGLGTTLRRAAAFLTVGLLGFVVASPALAALASHTPHSADTHEGGVPCPDGDPGPCESSCPCLCCPGHGASLAAAGPILQPQIAAPAGRGVHACASLHVLEVVHSLFRPPEV